MRYELLQELSSLYFIVASLPNKDDAAELVKHYLVQRTQTKLDHKTALYMAKARVLTKCKEGAEFGISSYRENEEFVKKYDGFIDFAFHYLMNFGGFVARLHQRKGKNREGAYYIIVKRAGQEAPSLKMGFNRFKTLPDCIRYNKKAFALYFFYRVYIGLNHKASVKMVHKLK